MHEINNWLMKTSLWVIAADLKKSEISIQTWDIVKIGKEPPSSKKEKDDDSLLDYEYDEDDDGVDWET